MTGRGDGSFSSLMGSPTTSASEPAPDFSMAFEKKTISVTSIFFPAERYPSVLLDKIREFQNLYSARRPLPASDRTKRRSGRFRPWLEFFAAASSPAFLWQTRISLPLGCGSEKLTTSTRMGMFLFSVSPYIQPQCEGWARLWRAAARALGDKGRPAGKPFAAGVPSREQARPARSPGMAGSKKRRMHPARTKKEADFADILFFFAGTGKINGLFLRATPPASRE